MPPLSNLPPRIKVLAHSNSKSPLRPSSKRATLLRVMQVQVAAKRTKRRRRQMRSRVRAKPPQINNHPLSSNRLVKLRKQMEKRLTSKLRSKRSRSSHHLLSKLMSSSHLHPRLRSSLMSPPRNHHLRASQLKSSSNHPLPNKKNLKKSPRKSSKTLRIRILRLPPPQQMLLAQRRPTSRLPLLLTLSKLKGRPQRKSPLPRQRSKPHSVTLTSVPRTRVKW